MLFFTLKLYFNVMSLRELLKIKFEPFLNNFTFLSSLHAFSALSPVFFLLLKLLKLVFICSSTGILFIIFLLFVLFFVLMLLVNRLLEGRDPDLLPDSFQLLAELFHLGIFLFGLCSVRHFLCSWVLSTRIARVWLIDMGMKGADYRLSPNSLYCSQELVWALRAWLKMCKFVLSLHRLLSLIKMSRFFLILWSWSEDCHHRFPFFFFHCLIFLILTLH